MRNRLVLLVLFPLTVVAISVGLVANDRQSESRAASEVEAQVEGLRALVGLQTALYGERAAVEIEFRSASFGMPPSFGAVLLGVGDSASTFGSTDRALREASRHPPGLDAELARARELLASGDERAIAHYETLDDMVVAAIIETVETMQRTGLATGDPDLATVLEQLEASVKSFSAATDQTTRLAATWFGSPQEQIEARSELGRATAAFDLAVADVDPDRVPADLRTFVFDRSDPVTSAVAGALEGELAEIGLETVSIVIGVFAGSFARNGAFATLVDQSADDVEATSARISADASRAYQMALVIGGIAVLASILFSWRLATSISGPMGGVAERTRELRAGRIDPSPLPLEGPREVHDIAAALNDVSANLDSLERKLDALARAELSDPVLHERLPGRLGETLSKSVDTLSASVADRANLQSRLAHEATHDALTGLANRSAAIDRMATALRRGPGCSVGVLFVDLDGFKRANDLFGHQTGDLVLCEVAGRLVDACRPGDLVARLGGDEFLIVVDADPTTDELERQALRIADRMLEPLGEQSAGGLVVAGSVGVAMAIGGSTEPLELLAWADAALYRAKVDDARVAVFDDELAAEVFERASIEQRLRESLVRGEFEVHYQPILTSDSLDVVQVEALVRWTAPDGLGPGVFIPVAENSDLVVDLDRFVLGRATQEIAALLALEATDLAVAVNISGRHLLHARFVEHVREALAHSGLEPSRLIIEVTETALVADLDRAALHLEALRRMGVRTSVDDFGTGFTSISQLRRLPIDELKIDQSLVRQLPGDQALIRVVRDLADHFGMTTVAEGVERREQADALRDIGCSQLQGWLYAQAMPAADLGVWLDQNSGVAAVDSP